MLVVLPKVCNIVTSESQGVQCLPACATERDILYNVKACDIKLNNVDRLQVNPPPQSTTNVSTMEPLTNEH